MKLFAAVILFAMGANPALAQSPDRMQVALRPDGALLNVTAEGRSERRPDMATFNAGVVTQSRTAGEAMSTNNTKMNALVASLKRLGIAERDIQTSTLNLQPQYVYPEPPRPVRQPDGSVITQPAEPQAPRIIGYEARNTVTVKVRRIEGIGSIIDALVSAGSNQVDGPYFTLQAPEQANDEARADALRAARRRADLYAREAGFSRARIVTITEGGGYYPATQTILVTGRGMGTGAPPPPPPPPAPVQPGEVTLGVSLSVQFALE